MNAETLSIRMKLDIAGVINDVKKVKTQLTGMAQSVKQSIPKIGTESKKAKEALNGVTKASKEVTKALDGIGDEAQESLSTVSKQGSKIAQMLASVGIGAAAVKAGMNTDDLTASTDRTVGSIEKMEGVLGNIQSLSFAGLASSLAILFNKPKQKAIELQKQIAILKKTMSAYNLRDRDDFDKWIKDVDVLTAKETALTKATNAARWATVGFYAALTALAATLTTVVAVVNTIKISKLGAEIYRGAQQVGMSAQAYQEWQYVLEQVGIEASELTEVIKTLTEAQVDVINQDESFIAAFKKLGMSAEEVKSMGQDALWDRTIAALQNVENATERTAIAYKIFGEDAAKLTTILNMSNADTQKLIGTYNKLSGAMSKELIHNSAVLQGSLSNLRVAWQGLRNTLAQAVIPAVIAVVDWITKAIVVVNVFLQKFFNLDLTAATESMTKGVTGTTGAMGGYTDAVNGATKAVEKLKRTTMGFDELNIVGNPNASSGADTGSGAGTGTGAMGAMVGSGASIFAEASKEAEAFKKKVEDFMDKWGWAIKGIGIALGALTIRKLLIQLASAFDLGDKVAEVLSFKGITDSISGLGTKLGTFFATLKGGGGIMASLTAAFPKVAGALTSIATAGGKAFAAVGKLFGLTGGAAITGGAFAVAAAIAAVASVVIYLRNNWDEATATVKNFFAENIKPKLDSIKASLEILIPPKVLEALKKMWQGIKDIVGAIAEWFAKIEWIKMIGAIFEKIGEIIFNVCVVVIGGAISMVLGFIDGTLKKLASLKQVVVGIGGWFTNLYPKFESFFTKIKKLFSNIGTAIANGITGAVKSVVNTLLRNVANKINTFIGWINAAIGLINKIPGVNIGKITKLEVPQLATGGIVTSETIARIGEKGKKEAVLPLEQNTGWMDTLAQKIAAKSGSDQPINVHLDVDGTTLGWVAIRNINSITKQTGKVQLAW